MLTVLKGAAVVTMNTNAKITQRMNAFLVLAVPVNVSD